jgi:hypothetical protein
MNTHQILIILVVDTRVLGCVADSLQERRLASISPTDYKDTKASIYCSKIIGIHDECKEGLRGKNCVVYTNSESAIRCISKGPPPELSVNPTPPAPLCETCQLPSTIKFRQGAGVAVQCRMRSDRKETGRIL